MEENDFYENLDKALEVLAKQFVELKFISNKHNQTVETFKTLFPEVEKTEFQNFQFLHRFQALITVSRLDLLTILKFHKSCTHSWDRVFLTKKTYLIIYEAILKIHQQQKDIRSIINEHCDEKKSLLIEINDELKHFKKNYDFDKIKNIRNKVSGHIDEDFDKYYEIIMDIDPQLTINSIRDIVTILNRFHDFLLEVQETINDNLNLKMKEVEREAQQKISELMRLIKS